MKKIEPEFVKDQYRSGIASYSEFTKEVGLWDSEQYVFTKYLKPTDHILDLGCGTGRTTFPLYQLGYRNIKGVDLTPEMIQEAKQLNHHFHTSIEFKVGDATSLAFGDASFDSVIFSFNGLMSIPSQLYRNHAIQEIGRVLKKEGIFIFTTHDRDREEKFIKFWQHEKEKWDANTQDTKLHEFGDLITTSKNESREIFIHIPNQKEISTWLQRNGFQVLETFYRIDKFAESERVKAKSGECRFWITQSTQL